MLWQWVEIVRLNRLVAERPTDRSEAEFENRDDAIHPVRLQVPKRNPLSQLFWCDTIQHAVDIDDSSPIR
jgi:hypothetical protein